MILKRSGNQEHAKFWEFHLEEKEIKKMNCGVCQKKIEFEDKVYACNACKKMVHRKCVYDEEFESLIMHKGKNLFPCHDLSIKYCGKVKKLANHD